MKLMIPKNEDTFSIKIEGDMAKIIFQDRNGNCDNPSEGSFEWIVKKENNETFTRDSIAIFIEAKFQEQFGNKMVLRLMMDKDQKSSCFRVYVSK